MIQVDVTHVGENCMKENVGCVILTKEFTYKVRSNSMKKLEISESGLDRDDAQYEEWYSKFEEFIDAELAETGADREMDFDREREFEKRYEMYLANRSQNIEGNKNG